jgi:GNAT superfamily N-acetyltransferase
MIRDILLRDKHLPLAEVFAGADSASLADYHLQFWKNARTIEHSADGFDAVCIYQDLPWDSELLGLPCTRILYANAFSPHEGIINSNRIQALQKAISECVDDCKSRGIRMIDARVSTRDLFIMRAFEQAGFHTVDSLVTLGGDRKTLERMKFAPVAEEVTIRPFQPSDEEALAQMSYDAFGDFEAIQDRFFVEPMISHKRSQELFREWFRNLAKSTLAGNARIVVADVGGEAVGYVGIEPLAAFGNAIWWKDSLNAVSETARGKGLYRALVAAAVKEALDAGASGLFTKTQISTNRVINTWLHAGANLLESSTTLHWIHDTH